MKIRYNFFLDDNVITKLKAMATEMNVPVSEIIRYAIDDHIQTYGHLQPKPTVTVTATAGSVTYTDPRRTTGRK